MNIVRHKIGPILLTQKEGTYIKTLIHNHYRGSQASYAEAVGIQPSNLSLYLGGTKPLSDDLLNKILMGIKYGVICEVIIQVHPLIGADAKGAPSVPLEEMLLQEDRDSLFPENESFT